MGPLAVALTGVPAGRLTDRFGAGRATLVGLLGMTAGCVILSKMPAAFGVPGYIAPLVVITASYALFQTANNTAVMTDVVAGQRGVISGLLNLSRSLGLITGASVMGAVFALASGTTDVVTARPEDVATGLRITLMVAALLVLSALALAVASRVPKARWSVSTRPSPTTPTGDAAKPGTDLGHEVLDGDSSAQDVRRGGPGRQHHARLRALTPQSTRGERADQGARGSCCGQAAEGLFKMHGIRPKRIIDIDRESVTRTLIAGGVGVGLLHAETAHDARAKGEVELVCEAQKAVRVLFAHLASRARDPLIVAVRSLVPSA